MRLIVPSISVIRAAGVVCNTCHALDMTISTELIAPYSEIALSGRLCRCDASWRIPTSLQGPARLAAGFGPESALPVARIHPVCGSPAPTILRRDSACYRRSVTLRSLASASSGTYPIPRDQDDVFVSGIGLVRSFLTYCSPSSGPRLPPCLSCSRPALRNRYTLRRRNNVSPDFSYTEE